MRIRRRFIVIPIVLIALAAAAALVAPMLAPAWPRRFGGGYPHFVHPDFRVVDRIDTASARRARSLNGDTRVRAVARLVSDAHDSWLAATFGLRAIETTDPVLGLEEPALPQLGLAYLALHHVDPDGGYLEKAGRVRDLLLRGQLVSGGWSEMIVFTRKQRYARWRCGYIGTGAVFTPLHGMFKRRVVTDATRFLMLLDAARPDDRTRERARLALRFILEAQLPGGGWPGFYRQNAPAQKPYNNLPTLNDGVIALCIEDLLLGYRLYGDAAYLEAAKQGGDFLRRTQVTDTVSDGQGAFRQAGWGHHFEWREGRTVLRRARLYELPAVYTPGTCWAVLALMRLAAVTGDPAYLEPVPAALEWLRRSVLTVNFPGRWSCFYEEGTNRPFYCRREANGKRYLDRPGFDPADDPDWGRYLWVSRFRVDDARALWQQIERNGLEGLDTGLTRVDIRTDMPPERIEAMERAILARDDEALRRTESHAADVPRLMEYFADYLTRHAMARRAASRPAGGARDLKDR